MIRSQLAAVVGLIVLVAAATAATPARFTAVMHKAQLSATQTITLRPEGTHPTLFTGEINNEVAEPTEILAGRRARLHPSLFITESEGKIVDFRLDYGPEAFAIPSGTLTISSRFDKVPVVSQELRPFVGSQTKVLDLDVPALLKNVATLPDEMLVELSLHHQEVTTLEYHMPNGFTADMLTSGQSFDLQPINSTMMCKFMVRLVRDPDDNKAKMSIWVSRKPVAPDFTLIFSVDGEIRAQANVEHDPTSNDALGFDFDVTDFLEQLRTRSLLFTVHFYEFPRKHYAKLSIPNLRSTINSIREDSGVFSFDGDSNVLLKLMFHRGMDFIGMYLVQQSPIEDVMLSLYRVNKSSGERTLFLRETDTVVPFYNADGDQHYGWDDALPSRVAAVTADGEDLFDAAVEVELWYNVKRDPSIAGDFARWITTNGGRLADLDFSFLDMPDHSYERRHPLTCRKPLNEGDVIAVVPYSLLLTSAVVDRQAWAERIINSSAKHQAHVAANKVHPDAARILRLTAVVALQLFDESMNYRPYFNTFSKSANKLAPYFTEDELRLFSFDEVTLKELQRMRDLWAVEFETLQESKDHFPRVLTEAAYKRVRSQVETRMVNMSGELVLAPVMDLLTHSDTPNAKIEYSDETHTITIYANERIPATTPITIDFGSTSKTAVDFLVQFGFVPPRAVDAVTLDIPGLGPSYLTSDPASRKNLANDLAARRGADDGDDKSEEDVTALGDVTRAVKERFNQLSSVTIGKSPSARLAADAEALLRISREVLSKHMQSSN